MHNEVKISGACIQACLERMSGGVARAVEARMPVTLSRKNVAISSPESYVECCFGGCSISFTARHDARGYFNERLND